MSNVIDQIKSYFEKLSLCEKIVSIGEVHDEYSPFTEWTAHLHELILKEKMNEPIECGKGKLYPIEIAIVSLDIKIREPNKELVREKAIYEIWSIISSIEEKTDIQIKQKSEIVQEFIKIGYKSEYEGVPQVEFKKFADANKKKFLGVFGGRKSRKQNKSRKQGKSKKQRKSRK
jgi:hypothetical protein